MQHGRLIQNQKFMLRDNKSCLIKSCLSVFDHFVGLALERLNDCIVTAGICRKQEDAIGTEETLIHNFSLREQSLQLCHSG